jgi:Cu(I)/Ag(I) efflux system membrane protein CusA/SilA
MTPPPEAASVGRNAGAARLPWTERVIDWSARHPFTVLSAVLALALLGLGRMWRAPLDAIPDLSDPQVIVLTAWPGRGADLVEDQITFPLLHRLNAAPQVKTARGLSFFGYSYLYLIFEEGTDLYWARARVTEILQAARAQLPSGVSPVLGPDATGVGWGFQYALVDRSGRQDAAELRAFQDWHLRPALQGVAGVAEIASFGGFEQQYQVEVDDHRLQAYGVTLADMARAIRAGNRDAGGREVEHFGTSYVVRGHGRLRSLDDLRAVAVGRDPATGVPVTLAEVARSIELGPEMRRGAGDLDGEGETAGGIVVVRFGENVLAVLDRVKAKLEALRPALPPGVEVVVTYDRSDLIRRAIGTLRRTLVEESILVAVVVLVFLLDLGGAVRAVITLPLAVCIAFIPLQALGLTTNIMSLGGIAIAIGAMVDEAVVMVENVHKRLEHLPPGTAAPVRREVVIAACRQLGRPLFFALLLITVSFLPVFALEAEEGRLFKPLAWTKTFAMAAAALLSITAGPALLAALSGRRVIPERRHPISRLLQRVYYPWVSALMRRRRLSMAIGLLAVLSCLPVARHLGSEFMPALNEGDILYMPSSWPTLSIGEAVRVMRIQDHLFRQFPETLSVHGKVGRAETATDPAPMEMFETLVRLKPPEQWRQVARQRWYSDWAPAPLAAALRPIWPDTRRITLEELVAEMDAVLQIPGAPNVWTLPIKNRIDMNATGIRTPVGVKVFGPDMPGIERVADRVEKALRGVPGTRAVVVERPARGQALDIEPDRAALARHGLSVEDLWMAVETAIGGMAVDEIVLGRERYTVNVRYPREQRDTPEAIRRLRLPVSSGAMGDSTRPEAWIPLGEVATVRLRNAPAMIRNEGGALCGWVYVDIAGRDVGGYLEEARQTVRREVEDAGVLAPGQHLAWAGQYEHMQRVRARLAWMLPLTLALIVALLHAQFRSLPAVGIILLSLPFALTGGVWMIWALDYNLSVAVWIGFIALAGLAAQTGIVMWVYLEEAFHLYRRAGRLRTQHDLFEAITYGAVQRVRPKVMTVTTTLFSLLPLLLSDGAGADVMKRVAAPMVGGLLTSFVLTLELLPALYALWRGRSVTWTSEPAPVRPSWDTLRERFHALEQELAAPGAPGPGHRHSP